MTKNIILNEKINFFTFCIIYVILYSIQYDRKSTWTCITYKQGTGGQMWVRMGLHGCLEVRRHERKAKQGQQRPKSLVTDVFSVPMVGEISPNIMFFAIRSKVAQVSEN